jgi:hypothetical protein
VEIEWSFLPMMQPRSFLNRLERYFKIGREDGGLCYDMTEFEPNQANLEVVDPAACQATSWQA